MKKLILGVGFLLLGACKHTAPVDKPVTALVAAPTQVTASSRPRMVPGADSLEPETRALLRAHDLTPLWANKTDGLAAPHAMEGFFGTAPYRISFYFTNVVRDARQPGLFHITGLDRYHKVVTPFNGTIQMLAVKPFADSMWADVDTTARCFTATARFVLQEDPRTKGAGTYSGQALLDFYLDSHGKIGQAGGSLTDTYSNPTQGSGLLFEGSQVSNATGRRQPVAFANFYGAVVPQALNKLGLGDRSEEVNPNLAKLGWNEAWENDEWWVDSPKPSLNL